MDWVCKSGHKVSNYRRSLGAIRAVQSEFGLDMPLPMCPECHNAGVEQNMFPVSLDAKYSGAVLKNTDGSFVPPDEWVAFRAKDDALLPTLIFYRRECERIGAGTDQMTGIDDLIFRVRAWRAAHPEACKVPDVAPGEFEAAATKEPVARVFVVNESLQKELKTLEKMTGMKQSLLGRLAFIALGIFVRAKARGEEVSVAHPERPLRAKTVDIGLGKVDPEE